MSQEQNLRISDNHVEIVGKLLEKEFKEGKTQNGVDYLNVTLTIGIDKTNQIRTNSFAMKYFEKKDGERVDNWAYENLREVVDEYKAAADVGEEEADLIKVEKPYNPKYTNGTIKLNEFVNEAGLRSNVQISVNNFSRVGVDELEDNPPKAKFDIEVVVDSVVPEIKDEMETERAILKAYTVVNERGKPLMIPLEFVIHEDGADFVLNTYQKGDTVRIFGDIINKKNVQRIEIETGFGKNKVEEKVTYEREFLVDSGTFPYDPEDPNHYSQEIVTSALAQRDIYLEELKENFKNQSGKNKAASNKAFDVKSTRSTNVSKTPF